MLAQIALAGLVVACGGRSGLDIPDVVREKPGVPVHPPPPPNPPIGDCPAALLKGAPTPMKGYCPTRAHRTPARLPKSPAIAWQLPPPKPLAYTALEIVVDDQARAYAAVDTALANNVVSADTLVAFDADGTTAWSMPFHDTWLRSLFLAADGRLRFVMHSPTPNLGVVSRDGTLESTVPLPDNVFGDLAVGRDGSLFMTLLDRMPDAASVAKLSPEGAIEWTTPKVPLCSLGVSPIALAGDDLAVFILATTTGAPCESGSMVARVLAVRSDGSTAWHLDFPGTWAIDPAVAPDGTVRVGVFSSKPEDNIHLVSVDASGSILWDTDLQGTAQNVWESDLAIEHDGTAIARVSGSLVAVASDGHIRWRNANDAGFSYSAVVDANGVLALSDGKTRGFDLATGQAIWTLGDDLPLGSAIEAPFFVGWNGAIVGTMYSSSKQTFFRAADP
jgi:outer membrane protein assembly factor BamB